MNVMYVLLPLAILLGLFFFAAFTWSVRQGDFDDLEKPAHQILVEDE